jgi:hypothetical protein
MASRRCAGVVGDVAVETRVAASGRTRATLASDRHATNVPIA